MAFKKTAEKQDTSPAVREPVTELEKAIAAVAEELADNDPDEVSADIARRILSAETVDAVLAPQATEDAESVLGIPLTVDAVRWFPSTFAEGPAFYALIHATDRRGTSHTITTGSETVLAQLLRIQSLGAFPVSVSFVQARKATARGFYPVWLEAVDGESDF